MHASSLLGALRTDSLTATQQFGSSVGVALLPVTPVRISVLPCRALVPAVAGITGAVAPFTSRRIVLPPLRESRSAPGGVRPAVRFFRRARCARLFRRKILPSGRIPSLDTLRSGRGRAAGIR